MVVRQIWLVPVISVVLTLAGMLSGYAIGVVKNHIPPLLPFISDGGTHSPEACYFAQFLNMASFFGLITFYIRHRQTVEYYGHRLHWEKMAWRWVSLTLMYIGIASAVGLTMVANFPLNEVPKMHMIGATLTFLSLMIYGWGQTILGYAMVPRMASMLVNHLRLLIMMIATPCFILHELATLFKIFVPKGAGRPPGGWHPINGFNKNSPFYLNYMIATSSEWAMALAMQMFVLSFVAELRYAYAHAPRVVFKRSCEDCPDLDTRHVRIAHDPPAVFPL